jgi:hypothetical protein
MSPQETKAVADQAHFIRRARERFGLKLTPERYEHLVRKVRDCLPGSAYLYATSPTRTVWRIRAGGRPIRVVYDETTDRLVTCLPISNHPAAHIPHKRFIRRLRRARRKRFLTCN